MILCLQKIFFISYPRGSSHKRNLNIHHRTFNSRDELFSWMLLLLNNVSDLIKDDVFQQV